MSVNRKQVEAWLTNQSFCNSDEYGTVGKLCRALLAAWDVLETEDRNVGCGYCGQILPEHLPGCKRAAVLAQASGSREDPAVSGAVRTWAFRRRGELIYFLQPGEARIEHTNGEWIEVEIRPVQAEKEREVTNSVTIRRWIPIATFDDWLKWGTPSKPAGHGMIEVEITTDPPPPGAGMKRGMLRLAGKLDPPWVHGLIYNDQASQLDLKRAVEIEYRVIENPPSPARCVCGADEPPKIGDDGNDHYIECERCGRRGPRYHDWRIAEQHWAAMMERAK